MRKKKKTPNLPNGYGSIKKLSGNRRNPYGVYPPVTEFTDEGKPIQKKALCYVPNWYVGFAVLTAYKAGTYTEGMEKDIVISESVSSSNMSDFVNKVLSDFAILTKKQDDDSITFSELYEQFYDWKYNGKKKLSKQSMYSTTAAYKNCKALHNRKITEITCDEMQAIVDGSNLKHSSISNMVSLLKQMYHYAMGNFMIEKDPTVLLKVNIEEDNEKGVPLTEKDIEKLWEHEKNDICQVLLMLCYSGFRIMELKSVEVNLDKMYFHGGLKNRSSKNRIVPIHSAIQHIVKARMKKYGELFPGTYQVFRNKMANYLPTLCLEEDHTSHDCRHTFSALCEKYGISDNDRKRLMGHSFNDVTNDVYGHRTIEDLREEIEKIPCHKRVAND